MKIPKEQWQKWASEHAGEEADDFSRHVSLSLEQYIILIAKIESAMLCGMEMTETMRREGYDTSEARDMKVKLSRL